MNLFNVFKILHFSKKTSTFSVEKQATIELRHKASMNRLWFQRARQREKRLQEHLSLEKQGRQADREQYEAILHELREELKESERRFVAERSKCESLQRQLSDLKQRLYGKKSEKSPSAPSSKDSKRSRGKRGQRRGSRGHGRKRPSSSLKRKDIRRELSVEHRVCRNCGRLYVLIKNGERISERIVINPAQILVERHHYEKYVQGCDCANQVKVKSAPVVNSAIGKSILSDSSWAYFLTGKYVDSIPVHRLLEQLKRSGLSLSAGTVTGGFKQLEPLFAPVHEACRLKMNASDYWHMDETGYHVYELYDKKKNSRCWLWVSVGTEAVYFTIDPSRSGSVARRMVDEGAVGYLMVDRYAGYKSMPKGIVLLFCWAHVRRDFVKEGKQSGKKRWANWYIKRIGRLYHAHKKMKSSVAGSLRYQRWKSMRGALLEQIHARAEQDMGGGKLAESQRKVLKSLIKHWSGLTAFTTHDYLPIDNNEAERRIRLPVVGRKNFYGIGSQWSARLASAIWSIGASCKLHDVDPYQYLTAYLEACGRHGGRAPDDLSGLLPWDFSQEARAGP